MELYDVIIIGGSSAGLSSAIYACRRNLKTLVITREVGGQAAESPKIENYPGFLEISGSELIKSFQEQALKAGAQIIFDEVNKIEEIIKADKIEFLVKTSGGREFLSRSLILAFGKTPKKLGAINEDKFIGKGISYCTICDGPLFKNKIVSIVGGGNSAFSSALYLSSIAKKVYLIHRREEFRAFEKIVEEAKKKENIEFLLNCIVKEVKGDYILRSLIIENLKTNEEIELKCDGLFIEIGSELKTDFVKHLVKTDEDGQIVVNLRCQTFYPNSDEIRPGIFAAGDVTNIPYKQVVISAGTGAIAALEVYNYLSGIKTKFFGDWVHKNDGGNK
ncbi:MAG: FAD-dependent oxidoreductase [Candidatus Aenigmatarchaeota archaeon]